MRVKPRQGADSLQHQYEQALVAGIALQEDYMTYLGQAMDLQRAGDVAGARELREGLDGVEARIIEQLAARVDLLRRAGDLQTMDTLLARLVADTATAESAAVFAQFEGKQPAPRDGTRKTAAAVEDASMVNEVRATLARQMGYTVKDIAAEWLTVWRNGVEMEFQQAQSPSADSVTGKDRILEISVAAEVAGSSRTVSEYRGKERPFLPSVDPKVQAEIDRVIAVFG